MNFLIINLAFVFLFSISVNAYAEEIPNWVRNNAGWWADGLISNSDFMSGIEFMAKNGMIGNVPPKKSLLSDIMDIQTESNEQGVKITWTNNDLKSHTITSGNLVDGPNGIFDSSLFSSERTYSLLIQDVGNFDYFCMVHP